MRRAALTLAAVATLVLALGACGVTSTVTGSGSGSTPTTVTCPTASTKAFPRLRFATDVGLVAGSFHHWIWAPYRRGSFAKGAHGRLFALTKASATAVFIDHEAKAAISDVEASPSLCRAIGKPLGSLATSLDSLGTSLRHGDVGSLASIEAGVAAVLGEVRGHGVPVTEQHAG